nr:hypothetical protein [Tanacetum cinerariifolium]
MAPKRTTKSSPATTTTTTTSVTDAQLKELIDQGIARALAAHDADRNSNGNDSHVSGTGARRMERVTRECTYPDFMKCKPLNFKGTEGVVELTQWFKKMETMFRISNCSMENQIKFSTCTLLGSSLTWWNSHVMTIGPDAAYAMTWVDMKKKRPKTMQEAIEMANELMDKRNNTLTKRQAKNKRKQDDNNNQAQQQPLKKPGVAIAYTAGPGERKEYARTLPLCNKFKFHHNGQCTVKCVNCKRVGHLTRDCRSPAATNNHMNFTCYECGNQGHYINHGNQAGGIRAHGMVHAFGGGETNQNLNDVEDDINA